MSLQQRQYLVQVIKGYHFTYKATGESCYRISRDKLIKQLRSDLKSIKLHILKAA